jgi:hypothetical protein
MRVIVGGILIAGLGVISNCGGDFGTLPPPSSFILTSPSNTTTNAVGTSPTLISVDATGETGYTVQISTDRIFGGTVNIFSAPLSANTTSYLCTAPTCSLVAGTSYYWQVLAINNLGVTKAANAPFTFVP